ncbi:hypothetical protein POVWA1_044330 [Plasmodium ovale wallikeri]|uniref:Uncharacterized protein n=1 Tax=Plasmodium ovale wallikeri TaxID=864142 RepID=A0A1A8ZCS5_PLAOA|nr:hypothetical protein POVWA1_044330 [Plasmodium ovale wallikeri]
MHTYLYPILHPILLAFHLASYLICIPSYLHPILLASHLTCIPSYLHTYLRAYLPAYAPAYAYSTLSAHVQAHTALGHLFSTFFCEVVILKYDDQMNSKQL